MDRASFGALFLAMGIFVGVAITILAYGVMYPAPPI